jgi:predicted nucleic acid-binding protein
MSYNYVIDASAWMEYFLGTENGIKIKPIIEREEIATSIIAIAELADRIARDDQRFNVRLQFIQRRAAIIGLSVELCLKAAQLKKVNRRKKEKFGLADGVHLATAQQEGAVLVTSDNDFSGIENVMLI